MDQKPDSATLATLLALLPSYGSALGNARLHEALSKHVGRKVKDYECQALRDQLVEWGNVVKSKGHGGPLA